MTVTSTTNTTAPIVGDGSATTFSFSPMVIYASTDIKVVSTVVATGVSTTLTEGTGAAAYSVGITTYPATGSITYPEDEVTPITSATTLTIIRDLPITQTVDLTTQGPYNPDTLEQSLDKLTILVSQMQEQLDRGVVLPVGHGAGYVSDDAIPVAGAYLKMDSDLNGVAWSSLTTTTGAASDTAPLDVSVTAADAGAAGPFSREDHVHLLADNAVTLAKMAGGTDGELIGIDASGDPAYIAAGTAGQVLTSNGVGTAATMTSPGFEFVSTAAISAAATLSPATAFAAGYDYKIVLEAFGSTTDDKDLYMLFSDDAGVSYEVGAADYTWCNSVAGAAQTMDVSDAQIVLSSTALGSDAGTVNTLEISLINPTGTSENTTCYWSGFIMDVTAAPVPSVVIGGGRFLQDATSVDNVQFTFESAATFKAQGDITVWRRRRS